MYLKKNFWLFEFLLDERSGSRGSRKGRVSPEAANWEDRWSLLKYAGTEQFCQVAGDFAIKVAV